MTQRKFFVIIGSGDFAREVCQWITNADPSNDRFEIKGYLKIKNEDNDLLMSRSGYLCLGIVSNYLLEVGEKYLMGIASPEYKKDTIQKYDLKSTDFSSYIHPSALISPSASIGNGCIFCPYTIVSSQAKVGDFVSVNCFSGIGHDSSIGQYVTLSGHVDITGNVEVGEGVFIGSGVKTRPRIKIGSNSRIGIGSILTNNIRENSSTYTHPAKKL